MKTEEIVKELIRLGINPPRIIYYEETGSTNTEAKEYAKSNPKSNETVVFIANSQTAGRGRRGRSFVSVKGAGIYMSILSYPKESVADATAVTAKAAVALSRAIEEICKRSISIKWVNDIYLNGKKLAGILTEGEVDKNGKLLYQVVGMGINIYKNAISDEISNIATSIEGELNYAPNRSVLAARMIKEFLSTPDNCYDDYKNKSFLIGKKVTVVKLSESYEATVIDINPDFSLQIERNGEEERLFTGEISLKIR